MPMHELPVVGAVYEDEDGRTFEVVNFDEDEGAVEVEYENGAVEEMDIDAWYLLDVEQISDEDEEEEEEYEDEDDDYDDEDDDDYDEEDDDDR